MSSRLSLLRRSAVCATLLLLLSIFAPASRAAYASDIDTDPVVRKIQATWYRADLLMVRSNYASAVAELKRGNAFLPQIKNRLSRDCVSDGAQQRINMARKGHIYLTVHRGDTQGANRVAQEAWKGYRGRNNCP